MTNFMIFRDVNKYSCFVTDYTSFVTFLQDEKEEFSYI